MDAGHLRDAGNFVQPAYEIAEAFSSYIGANGRRVELSTPPRPFPKNPIRSP